MITLGRPRRPWRTGALSCAALALLLAGCERDADRASSTARARTPGPRVSMAALHATGGVPPGWRLAPPAGDVAAGRRLFVDFGCQSCHRVAGEPFAAKDTVGGVGPELTGMGAHHPPAYFAESIMNPDAILIDEPGFVGPDGHSVMPDYPDMTIAQLADLVAYLSSLRTGDPHAGHVMPVDAAIAATVPPPPPQTATAFFSQSYDVKPGRLDDFARWFKSSGGARFLALDGLLGVDTYVDTTRARNQYTSIWSFRDQAALQRFTQDAAAGTVGLEFDGFIGDHEHLMRTSPPLYRAPALSLPGDAEATAFSLTSYDVNPSQIEAYARWFASSATPRLAAVDGLVSVVTWVDLTRPQRRCTSVFGFRDGNALQRFTQDPTAAPLAVEMDGFLGPHQRELRMEPPIRRVDALSAP